ncbi:MAG TPA: DUF1559 domain-containing protein [Capsulimonadaceae bacterium]|jgi:prepilin-type N-terminal cleavage/methylation domain-containing protein/prepilin-type processing-associated H-X9-DG protein
MKRNGFTLIELLVVIAIIAILAAILFPVFATAREKARQTSCASNEKQITLAMIQYSNDYDEVYPAIVHNTFVGGSWVQTNGWAYQIYPYVKSYGSLYCPDDTIKRNTNVTNIPVSYTMPDNLNGGSVYTGSNFKFHSGMAGWIGGTGSDWRAHMASDVEAPATTLMLVEYYFSGNTYACNWNGCDMVSAPSMTMPCATFSVSHPVDLAQDVATKGIPVHAGGWNYGFADGHVKFLTPEKTVGTTATCTNSGANAWNAGMWSLWPTD